MPSVVFPARSPGLHRVLTDSSTDAGLYAHAAPSPGLHPERALSPIRRTNVNTEKRIDDLPETRRSLRSTTHREPAHAASAQLGRIHLGFPTKRPPAPIDGIRRSRTSTSRPRRLLPMRFYVLARTVPLGRAQSADRDRPTRDRAHRHPVRIRRKSLPLARVSDFVDAETLLVCWCVVRIGDEGWLRGGGNPLSLSTRRTQMATRLEDWERRLRVR
ncbi:hypothetical protein HWV62_23186 [Athelia sp. TMB]|nr:hypothetical protein HWV62_23186 [Athelia sp. TMB]